MIWFTSDPHYWHKNVITYCNRPFGSVEDMNSGLIRNYNAVVQDTDTVYFLGDVIFGGSAKVSAILSELKGRKILVMGNHDRQNKAHKWSGLGFTEVMDSGWYAGFKLSHFPYRGDNHDARYFAEQLEDDGVSWLLHGHVHQSWKQNGRMINVGVDVWDYAPVSFETLLEMKARGYVPAEKQA
jgi:calcineurin-like phosphoesterase family protein